MPRINIEDFETDDAPPMREKIRRNQDPVNDGHDFKRGAENFKNRATKLARKHRERARDIERHG